MSAPPNILFVVADQHRHEWVGMSEEVPVKTPALSRLADRGVWFSNAVCPSPVCGPSRACVASGNEYDRCGLPHHDTTFPIDERTTYVEMLRDRAGYHTMGAGKFLDKFFSERGLDGTNRIEEFGFVEGTNSYGKWASVGTVGDPRDPYQAFLEEQGLAEVHYQDFEARSNWTVEPTPLPGEAYNDNWIGRQGLGFLEAAPEDTPWFLEVSFAGPHSPIDVTREMYTWYRNPDVDFPPPVAPGDRFDEDTHQEIRRNYAAMVENIDRWVGRYLDTLERRGERSNTLIVFTSDHGEMLGDHGLWTKTYPHQASVGVPLIIDGPDVNDADPIDAAVTTLDCHATFLDSAGIPIPEDVDSRSLLPVLSGEASENREIVRSGLGPWRLLYDGRYKYITGYDLERGADQIDDFFDDADRSLSEVQGATEPILFDLETDPGERRNIADQAPDVVDSLTEHLLEHD